MERRIYKTEIAGESIAVDPLLTLRTISNHPGVSLAVDTKLAAVATGGEETQPPGLDEKQLDDLRSQGLAAQGRLIAAARKAFDLAPYEATMETGFLDAEVWDVFCDFLIWLVKKNESIEKLPTSRKPTGSPVKKLTTKRLSDSGLTENAQD